MSSKSRKSGPAYRREQRTSAENARDLTLFERTGAQDCGNGFDPDIYDAHTDDDLRLTAEEIFEKAFDDWDLDEFAEQYDLDADYPNLDRAEAYARWRDGYKNCAVSIIQAGLDGRRDRLRDEMQLFYLFDDVPEADGKFLSAKDVTTGFEKEHLVERFDTLEDAISQLARLRGGSIAWGRGSGGIKIVVFGFPEMDTPLYWSDVIDEDYDAYWDTIRILVEDVMHEKMVDFHRDGVTLEQSSTINKQVAEDGKAHMNEMYERTIAELKRRGYKWEIEKNPARRARARARRTA